MLDSRPERANLKPESTGFKPDRQKNTNFRLYDFSLKPETKVLGQIVIFRASEPI